MGIDSLGANDSLDLSGEANRMQMQSWNPQWISESEEEFFAYEWQVEPGNGGHHENS